MGDGFYRSKDPTNSISSVAWINYQCLGRTAILLSPKVVRCLKSPSLSVKVTVDI